MLQETKLEGESYKNFLALFKEPTVHQEDTDWTEILLLVFSKNEKKTKTLSEENVAMDYKKIQLNDVCVWLLFWIC